MSEGTRIIKAFELRSGWKMMLEGEPLQIRRVGHDFENRIIDVVFWNGQDLVLPPYSEVEVVEASIDGNPSAPA